MTTRVKIICADPEKRDWFLRSVRTTITLIVSGGILPGTSDPNAFGRWLGDNKGLFSVEQEKDDTYIITFQMTGSKALDFNRVAADTVVLLALHWEWESSIKAEIITE